ncbi:MAG: 23S rRNA (adenine(2503)-C(2))-methyltransferase RlmN [Gammaproteobacteria bacterium]|nr:23S rRNA (adenine(2503)-C(2))-methyltransferase RlmN [Gammaproteobacteria bacterium]NNF61651.1 23S rRNA (adenine(2503)-C(2))-methyltransferase RlmN [Gammaproteobacteria bacterium]NNM20543.1 23S rRNA (adenine(2503)-C(2))-methyltransferase RlmN [Gammaproteobacteria bacterium]
MSSPGSVQLLGMTRGQLEGWLSTRGVKPFHARQMMKWIYRRGVDDFEAMTDLSKNLRNDLHASASIGLPKILNEAVSTDGTRKWLLAVDGGQAVETVFIPEPGRGTLCISSQVGCVLDCSFCATGAQGFNRNLTSAEIIGQLLLAQRLLATAEDDRPVTNVVLMGMGEPLANYRNVVPAMQLMLDDFGFELSRRRVTLSTSGLVPQIRRLASDCNVALAVSLHAPDDALRDELVPINRVHPVAELLDACWEYAGDSGRHITFEYVLLDGVNDSPAQARQLAQLLRDRPAKVNLIPFNPYPGGRYRRSQPAAIEKFQSILHYSGLRTMTRRPRGDDIAAACGQLAGQVDNRITSPLHAKAGGRS